MTSRSTSRSSLARSATVGALLVASASVLTAQARGAAPSTAPATAAGAAPAAGTPAAPAAFVPTPRQSWIADRRNYAVGDIITLLIDDYTITTAVKENTASDIRSNNKSLNASVRLPKGGTSAQVGIDSRSDAASATRGSAKRENRFQNEMSVRVVAMGPDGLLQVKGTKNINVDKNVQDIQLTGWVRAQDISPQNSVESARVADVVIGYASPGSMAKPKQGIISKVLGAFWP